VLRYECREELTTSRRGGRVTVSRSFFILLAWICLSCSASNSGSKSASASDADNSSTSTSAAKDDEGASNAEDDSSSSDATDEDGQKQKLPPGPSCLDQQGNIQECLSDTDCCKNYYCGIDPDGSARQKVCLYGG
jgi:hypothetical protein